MARYEEVRCDMNADFTEHLADSERFDEGHFWKERRAFEKKWRDPDDVYIEVERREDERKKLGLPSRVIGSILPQLRSGPGGRTLGSRAGAEAETCPKASEAVVGNHDIGDSEETPRIGKTQQSA
jgi:hypothetical protein